jgi:hypothetical protein
MTYTQRSEAGSEKIRTSIIQKVGGRFRVSWLGDGTDLRKYTLGRARRGPQRRREVALNGVGDHFPREYLRVRLELRERQPGGNIKETCESFISRKGKLRRQLAGALK